MSSTRTASSSPAYDVIILGAGAAGLMCASTAAKRGRSVLVLERNQKVGEKIRISGGGRCNFTNLIAEHDHYISDNPHFCKSALARFTPNDFLIFVQKHGIQYHEKKLGQLFCDGSSREIIAMLKKESVDAGVEIVAGCVVSDARKDQRFIVTTNTGEIQSDSLVIATGGLSIPKLGATDFGYRLAQAFGMNITATTPGLVPLVVKRDDLPFFRELTGVSLEAIVSCNKKTFREGILFTHQGLSGPAILQISSYWKEGDPISINLSPDVDLLEFLKAKQRSSIELTTALSEILPKRFAKQWCDRYVSSMPLHHYSSRKLETIAAALHSWSMVPDGTEGFSKAEVTVGGVDTNELSSKTMESKKVRGLYFIGEVVDVTGHLGGYNFQWAWASGFAAGTCA